MRILLVLAIMLCLAPAPALPAMTPADVAAAPSCRHCGMDRDKFGHSRMVIDYDDGSSAATCSLHCTAVELATTLDKTPKMIRVADYDTRELLDAEKAIWVMGGSKKGVMTRTAKWAFGNRGAAERFTLANGGSIVTFDGAIKGAYDDMYQDTRMIRENRKMKRLGK